MLVVRTHGAGGESRIHGIALNRQWDPASTFFWSIKYITQKSTTQKSIPEMHHSLNALAQCITQLNASLKFVVMPVKCISQMQTMLQSNEDNCIISQIHLVICIRQSISQKHKSTASVKNIQMHQSNASVKCISPSQIDRLIIANLKCTVQIDHRSNLSGIDCQFKSASSVSLELRWI
jgi:hypothetical protein